MPEIRTEFEINASPDRVWAVLADFAKYPQWNPFLIKVSGQATFGAHVTLKVRSPPVTVTFHVKVIVATPGKELRWKGHFGSERLNAGEHYFIIEPLDANRVRFIHGEIFTGALAPFTWPIMAPSTRRGYEAMNKAIKARAESSAV